MTPEPKNLHGELKRQSVSQPLTQQLSSSRGVETYFANSKTAPGTALRRTLTRFVTTGKRVANNEVAYHSYPALIYMRIEGFEEIERTRMMKSEPIRSPSFPTLEGPQGSSSSPPSTTGSTPSADMVLANLREFSKKGDRGGRGSGQGERGAGEAAGERRKGRKRAKTEVAKEGRIRRRASLRPREFEEDLNGCRSTSYDCQFSRTLFSSSPAAPRGLRTALGVTIFATERKRSRRSREKFTRPKKRKKGMKAFPKCRRGLGVKGDNYI